MEEINDALRRLALWCAERERAPAELKAKLNAFELNEEQKKMVQHKLVQHGFISEERFALAYARGKFRINKWGRLMIRQGLLSKGVSDEFVSQALASISEEDYASTLDKLLQAKTRSLAGLEPARKQSRLLRFAYSKGYNQEETWRSISRLGL
jgi:regulatory protein